MPTRSAQLTEKHRGRGGAGRDSAAITGDKFTRSRFVWSADGVTASWKNRLAATRREGAGEEARKEFERNVVCHALTLSSRVTGTRRESAYNERTLSVCALATSACARVLRERARVPLVSRYLFRTAEDRSWGPIASHRVASFTRACNRADLPQTRVPYPSLSNPGQITARVTFV